MNRKAKITRGVRKIQAEGQGIMQVTLVWQEEVTELLATWMVTQDPDAMFLLRIAQVGMKALAETPTLCLLCDATPDILEVAVLGCMHAAVDKPDLSIAFVICRQCADRPRQQTLKAASDKIVSGFTNMKRIEIHSRAGHA